MRKDQFDRVLGYTAPDMVYDAYMHTIQKYGIESQYAQALFLANLMHESNNLRVLVENLNYGAEGLLRVFPKYFSAANVKSYERQPEKIANRVYANRMGNGDEASGEGWKYRGRGAIQITGKSNYKACGDDIGIDLISNPDELCKMPASILSAGWFWKANNLNSFADKKDVVGATKKINGGLNGLESRQEYLAKALKVLAGVA